MYILTLLFQIAFSFQFSKKTNLRCPKFGSSVAMFWLTVAKLRENNKPKLARQVSWTMGFSALAKLTWKEQHMPYDMMPNQRPPILQPITNTLFFAIITPTETRRQQILFHVGGATRGCWKAQGYGRKYPSVVYSARTDWFAPGIILPKLWIYGLLGSCDMYNIVENLWKVCKQNEMATFQSKNS